MGSNNRWIYYTAYAVLVIGGGLALLLSERPLSATVVTLALFSFNLAAVVFVLPTLLGQFERLKNEAGNSAMLNNLAQEVKTLREHMDTLGGMNRERVALGKALATTAAYAPLASTSAPVAVSAIFPKVENISQAAAPATQNFVTQSTTQSTPSVGDAFKNLTNLASAPSNKNTAPTESTAPKFSNISVRRQLPQTPQRPATTLNLNRPVVTATHTQTPVATSLTQANNNSTSTQNTPTQASAQANTSTTQNTTSANNNTPTALNTSASNPSAPTASNNNTATPANTTNTTPVASSNASTPAAPAWGTLAAAAGTLSLDGTHTSNTSAQSSPTSVASIFAQYNMGSQTQEPATHPKQIDLFNASTTQANTQNVAPQTSEQSAASTQPTQAPATSTQASDIEALEPTDEAYAPAPITLLATIAVTEEDVLCVRGEGAGLNWQEGIPMTYEGSDQWSWKVDNITQAITCRIYLNDEISSFGEDIVLTPGQSLSVNPTFPQVEA